MRSCLPFATLALAAASLSAQPEREWRRYAPKGAGFEVLLPSDPAVKETPHGTETLHVAAVQRKAVESLGYVCQWLKAGPFANQEAEAAYLQGQQEGSLRASKGKLLAEKEIRLGAAAGREFVVAVSEGNVLRCRVFLAGGKVINLQVWGRDEDAVRSKDAQRFLASLKFSK
jgi:hypothetical protein